MMNRTMIFCEEILQVVRFTVSQTFHVLSVGEGQESSNELLFRVSNLASSK